MASLGGIYTIGRTGLIFMDAKYITTNSVQDSIVERSDGFTTADDTLGVGPATEAQLGTRLNITKHVLRGIIGFKMRNYTMTVKDVTYTEQHTNTFIGFRAGWSF